MRGLHLLEHFGSIPGNASSEIFRRCATLKTLDIINCFLAPPRPGRLNRLELFCAFCCRCNRHLFSDWPFVLPVLEHLNAFIHQGNETIGRPATLRGPLSLSAIPVQEYPSWPSTRPRELPP